MPARHHGHTAAIEAGPHAVATAVGVGTRPTAKFDRGVAGDVGRATAAPARRPAAGTCGCVTPRPSGRDTNAPLAHAALT